MYMINEPQNASQRILCIIFLTIFIDMIGIGILVPVFPMLIVSTSSFKIIPNAWSASDGLIMAGWLMSAFPLMQFLFAPILGQLSDRYGRRKILVLSIAGTAISYVLFAIGIITKNIPLLFISRALDGASGGNISVAQAVIGDVSHPDRLARNFGLVGVALGFGFILGPFMGGILSDPNFVSWFNLATPFWFAAILSAVNFILVLILLPETLKINNHKKINITKPLYNIMQIFKMNQVGNVIITIFLFNAGFTFFTTFWGVVLADRFGFKQGSIGGFFAYLGIMIVLAQGFVVRGLFRKATDYKILYFSIIGTGLCVAIYYLIPANHTSWIYYATPLLAVFSGLTKAFSMALLSRIAPTESRGEVMGVNSSASALSQSIPAIMAGYVAAYYSALPVLVGAIIIILAGILFIIFNHGTNTSLKN